MNKIKLSSINRRIKIDFFNGILDDYRKYLMFLALMIFLCILSINNLENSNATSGDIYFWLFKGELVKNILDKKMFELPAEWIFIFISIISILIVYPEKDLYERGYTSFIRSDSKINWWMGKIIWSVMAVTIMYLMLMITVIVAGFFNGGVDFSLSNNLSDKYNITVSTGIKYFISTYIYNYFVLIIIGILETTIALIFSTITSIGVIITYFFCGNFTNNIFFISNSTMIVRKKILSPIAKINIESSFFVGVLLSVIAIFAGYIIFRKKEIINKK